MSPTVAIIAAGAMGSAVAARLSENGVTVVTSLAGRSDASAKRAREAGMKDADDREIAEADFLLSIVPPGEGLALAQRLTPVLQAANRKPVFVDCNAVSPGTVEQIAKVVAAAGTPFVDAGIIGPPPKPGTNNTKFYASGAHAGDFAKLNAYGLIVRVLTGPPTAASALKMSYAGMTKGFTALGAAMMLAAVRGGTADALKTELAESQPALLAFLARSVPGMYAKAYRWVAELDEIGAFVGGRYPEHEMLAAAARLYERMADDFDGRKTEIAELDKFLDSR